jgi:hypothetical protein
MLLSHGGHETDTPNDIYLTAIYELHMPDVEAGTEKATEVEQNYTSLARGAANMVVTKIREWKVAGTLGQNE